MRESHTKRKEERVWCVRMEGFNAQFPTEDHVVLQLTSRVLDHVLIPPLDGLRLEVLMTCSVRACAPWKEREDPEAYDDSVGSRGSDVG
jgi:hypothetical protein